MRERDACEGGDEVVVEVAGDIDALPRSSQGELEVSRSDRGEGTAEQIPSEGLDVARQPRRVDRSVEQLGGLLDVASHVQDVAENRDEDRREAALARGTRDPQTPLRVGAGVVVAVQVELGGREIRQGVEMRRELVVGESVDQGRCVRAMALGLRDGAGERLAEGEDGIARRDQRKLDQRLRHGQRLLAPGAHPVHLGAVEVAHRELQHELDHQRRGGVRHAAQRGDQPRMRLLVTPEELLGPGAGADQAHAGRLLVNGRQADALEQRRTAVLEAPGRRLCSGEGRQQLDPLGVGRRLRQQAEGDLEPARRAHGRSRGRGLTGFAQDGDGLGVAVPGGMLDVMGARAGRSATGGERASAALVRDKPRARRARLVHRAPH